MILGFWALLTNWPIILPEVSKSMFGGRKRPLETFKSIAHTVDDVFWWLEQILKNDEKSSFLSIFLLWAQRRKIDKNDDFSSFFKICSNHQKTSSTVCAILLKVSRGLFRPPNILFDTSGNIIGQFVRSAQKPKIIKNINFDENSIFHTLAEIAQNDVISLEMGSLGVLGHLRTRNRYQNSFRSYFKAFWNFRFFDFFICGSGSQKSRNLPFRLQKGTNFYKNRCKSIGAPSEKFLSR